MRVILDATFISSERQSSYTYLEGLIPRLREFPEIQVEVLESPMMKMPASLTGNSKVHAPRLPRSPAFLKGPVRKILSRGKWAIEKALLNRSLHRGEKSIFHTYYFSPLPDEKMWLVANALDTIPEKFGKEFGLEELDRTQRPRKQACFQRADRIIAISEATKRDVIEVYGIPADKIDVSYLSIDENFFVSAESPFAFAAPYLLQVGGRQHHKNFSRLLEAFASSHLKKDYILVSAGEPWTSEERELIQRWGLSEDVHSVAHPTREELKALCHGAAMMVYPSLYEGFGMPLLEAMAAGIPVATSSHSGSIPEIAADAAVYFDARDPADIARAMERLTDPSVANEYVQKGFINLKRFSWERMARETYQTYIKVTEASLVNATGSFGFASG
jgi:glycosyltransferase involved in cell wall biosynthesis